MLKTTRPKAVLLDIDGTLLDSNEAHTHAWLEVLRRHGHPVAYEAVRALIGKGGDKVLNELLQIDAESPEGRLLSSERREFVVQQLMPTLRPTNGARALVQRFIAEGVQPVVATSSSAQELDGLLRQAGVADLVRGAATSDDAERSKPDPDIVQAALHKAGVAAGDAVMLGDTPFDVEAAAKARVATIALRCGGWWDAAAFGAAVAVFDDPADLLQRWSGSPFAGTGDLQSHTATSQRSAARPRIGCLAWGSLIWKSGPLVLASPWLADGPSLPIEFARVGDNGELSTALCAGADRMPTRWALLDVATVDEARELLRRREEIDAAQPQFVGSVPGPGQQSLLHAAEIAAWARDKRLDAVVWTALPPRFDGDNGRAPSPEQAVEYLRNLRGETRRHAEHYVRSVPREIATRHRRAIEAALGWAAAGQDSGR